MKTKIWKVLGCVLFALLAAVQVQGANGIIETRNYKICPGDTLTLDTRQTQVFSDTILYDTILVADPTQDSIYQYIVNVYPSFLSIQERTLERGTSFDWRGLTIDHAGTFEKVYKSTIGDCDSIYRMVVRERVEEQVVDTLCLGNSISFGNQTLTEGGIYRDTLHFVDYDSIVILTLHGIKPDTTIKNIRIPEGTSTTWNGNTYSEEGVYDETYTNRFGCDSLSRMILTVYHVDTIDTAVTICPNLSFTWHGMTYSQTGKYEFPGVRDNGDLVYYRLNLTVKELKDTTVMFTICDEETLTFNGKTYANAGTYYDYYSCDTLYTIIVRKHPSQLHIQTGVMDRTNPYYWSYMLDGEEKIDTLHQPGVYEHTSQNIETGCNDTWRLILTRDDNKYHFIETVTICENEDYSWRGRTGLNRTGIGQTSHYYDRYRTAADQDSIYELILTVNPVYRITQTIPFCNSVEWKGETITVSKVVVDSLTSTKYGCDSIITTIFSKGIPFHHHDTASIYPGEVLIWRGQTINHDGQYEDRYTSASGCDSIYSIGVGLKEAAPVTPTRTWREEVCEGTPYTWEVDHQDYYNSGTYVDTVWTDNSKTAVDSLHILILTVNPIYQTRERITFHSFPATYRGHEFQSEGEEYTFTYTTAGGCDSVIIVTAEFELTRTEEYVTICPKDTFIWKWNQQKYTESGDYVLTIKDKNDKDSVEHILHLTVNIIPDTYVNKTICKGGSYTFGDRTYTESGVYTYTFHETGCDSTVHLSLNVVNPDTNTYVHHMNQGDSYEWHNKTYRDEGTYFHYGTNRFGCDSVEILVLTITHVDTVENELTICQNEIPYVWHGIQASQTGEFHTTEQQPNGDYIYYRLKLKVLPIIQTDTLFTICDDQSISFNGKTYSEAGHYRDYLSCDTLVNITIVKHPQRVYETHGSLGANHPFTWTYWEGGVEHKDQPFATPGTYEYESVNETTGCSEIWRLILTKDETEYHFLEEMTVCEGDEFSWHGLSGLSHQGIGETTHYFDKYTTRAGKDSIYELVLTVNPVIRTMRTVYFCESIEFKGQTYTSSTVVYDTTALLTGCYQIERVSLNKAMPFYSEESKELPQGTVLHWHGQNITTDGDYYDYNTTVYGCDSIYKITVTIIPASPETNQYAEELSACEGDTILWRNRYIWRSGVYVDTVKKAGLNEIDSIFTLKFTAWPAPKDTIIQHLYTCGENASITYNNKDYFTDQTIITTFQTIHGCDSIVKVYLHFNTALYLSDTVEIADTELPYTWNYRLNDIKHDSLIISAGTYTHITPAEGSCYNTEQLVLIVHPTYLYVTDTTVCEMDLPFYWTNGPADHVTDEFQHEAGTTKQYEFRYQTIHNTDSIYRLNLTIDKAPRTTERYYVCEGYPQKIYDTYYGNTGTNMDTIYRRTIAMPSTTSVCDSIIDVEVYVSSIKENIQTVVLPSGQSYDWHDMHITKPDTYRDTTKNVGPAGCDSVDVLRVIWELGDERILCTNDTGEGVDPQKKYPLVWEHPQLTGNPKILYTTGTYRDTVFDANGYITDVYRMDLTVLHPYDTTIYVHGCQNKGAFWRDYIFDHNTDFIERVEVDPHTWDAPCDSVFHVHVIIDSVYSIRWDTTLCEYQLPLIVGRINPDTIWEERNFRHIYDTTACGCDSIIEGHLTIIPKLDRTDSTFVCEDIIHEKPVVLGDTVHPAFLDNDGGKWAGKWEGKWTGVKYWNDTIVWDCDHRYSHHIIVRPSQKVPKDTTYLLCEGDSVQLFWPKTQWIKKDTVYFDTVPMGYSWDDGFHGHSYYDQNYVCDSVTRWTVKFVHPETKDSTAHILLGDSIWWGGAWRYYTGDYDSIGPAKEKNSDSIPCQLLYTLHLINDTAYHFRDTVDICSRPNVTHSHVWSTGHEQFFTVGNKDTVARHYYDSLITYFRRDSVYDLCVNYRMIVDTLIFDTICEDTQYRFDTLRGTVERWLDKPGRYVDTLTALNGCDSIVTLQLFVRPRVITTPKHVTVTDRDLPYLWEHSWMENGQRADSTDTLRATGLYTFLMPSIHGCDSIDSLYLTVHQTHVFRDTIDVCDQLNKTLTHRWSTDYLQTFNTPLQDDTAFYADTLQTRIKYDSIYVLCVNFHQTYETLIRDTICEGERYRFDQHQGNITNERWVNTAGTYTDTIESRYGCDSVIVLKLFVRNRVPVTHKVVHLPDTAAPYLWRHEWMENGQPKDSTQSLTATGEYTFRMPSIYGCDSIDSLSLYFHNTYRIQEDSIVLCYDQTPYTWQDRNDITTTGDYYFHALTIDGYDSTRYVHITVLPILKTVITDSLCDGDSVRFGLTRLNQPRYLHETGIYYDTLTSRQHGCDSIIELRLNVFPKLMSHKVVHLPDTAAPFSWLHTWMENGQAKDSTELLYASGEYHFIMPTVHGCDSIDSLSLIFHNTYRIQEEPISICKDETPYTWQDRDDITESGDYTFYTQTYDGYDSIRTVHITVWPIVYDTIYASICEGDSLRFGLSKANVERFLHDAGTYNDTLTSIHGCDSIVTLHLNIYPKRFSHQTVHIADTLAPYLWNHTWAENGQPKSETDTLFATGEYSKILKSTYGCDSIDSLSLFIHKTYLFHDTVTVCQNATPYTWASEEGTVIKNDIYESGTYFRHLLTHDGYDSTYVRTVLIVPVPRETIHHSMCEGSDYLFKGERLTVGGTYEDTLVSHLGCDSIVTLILTVNKAYYNRIPVDIYEGESYTFFGETYTTSGTYRHAGLTPEGCDSITELYLRVHPLIDTIVTVCATELPYIWVNKWSGESMPLYQAGLYRNDTTYVNGERTFYSLLLNVNQPQFDTIRASICDGSSYKFKGEALTETGVYRDTVKASNGCDSVVTLVLTVNAPYFNHRVEHIIEGQTVQFFDTVCQTTGTYYHYGTTPSGCDSTSVLQLIVHPLVDTIVTVCSSELPYLWVNKWNGEVTPLYNAGLYRNDTTYVGGERMFYGLLLNVDQPQFDTIRASICQGASYNFKGEALTETGVYRDTVKASNGCDSVVTLVLTVNEPYFNHRVEHIIEGQTVQFFDTVCQTTGTYYHFGTTPTGCDSTSILQLIVHPLVDTIVTVCSNNELPYLWVNKWNGQVTPLYTAGIYRNDTTYVNGERMFYGLQLVVNQPKFDTIRAAVCEGTSYRFLGKAVSEAGTYRDTLRASNGCDSVVTLVLTVNEPYFNHRVEHIIEGQTVQFFDTVCQTTGTYYHYGTTPTGCDSTSILQLIVHPLVDTIVTVCSNNELPYLWVNKWNGQVTPLYTAGIYRNDTTYVNGERMFYGLQLVVNQPKFDTIRAAVCEGTSYRFLDKAVSEAGTYRDTLRASNGCDSVITLILTVNKPYFNHRVEHIIEGNSVQFFDTVCQTTGTYYHYGTTPTGCDSTSVLQLIVHPLVDTTVTVCSTDLPYLWVNKWNGQVTPLYSAGIYRNDTTFVKGERMYYGLQLVVNQPTDTTLYETVCEGTTYNFNGQLIKTAGEYRDTLKNANGCDSVIILHLNFAQNYYHLIERTIYEGDTVMFYGQEYSQTGNYPVRFNTVNGCDSVVELRLTVNKLFDDSVTVCYNELPLVWRGKNIFESGIYRDTTIVDGKEVVTGLKVNVLPIARNTEPLTVSICEGDVYRFGESLLSTQGVYYDTLTAANGCDSIVMLTLQVMPVEYQTEYRRIFEGESVEFYGETYTESGIYTHTQKNANGCTDTHQLILTVLKEFHVDTTAYVCKNELPFIWYGYEFNETGQYTVPTTWNDSARVLTTLNLTVRDSYFEERSVSLCQGNLFIYKKDTFSTNAIFFDTIPSQQGCDSILKYVVSVHPTFERWDTVHISDKQSYTFGNPPRELTITGDYESSGLTSHGCDSITHLHLVVHPSYYFKDSAEICQPDTFKWHGQNITESGIYFDKQLTKHYGFDSIYEIKVTVHPSYFTYEQYLIKEGETTVLHGINITKTDSIYTDTLHTIYGCDSIFQIAVNTKRMIDIYRDVAICDGDYYDLYGTKLTRTGSYTQMSPNGDTIAHIKLTVNPTSISKDRIVITAEDVPYIYGGRLYSPDVPIWNPTTKTWDEDVKSTIFTSEYLNQYGCDSTLYIEFVVTTHYSEWTQIPLCSGSQLIIDNDTIRTAGQYTFVRRSKETNRMDSLYRIEVYNSPTYEMPPVSRSICSGDTVHFGGKVFSRNGTHVVTLKTVDGCDSILTLNLTVNPSFQIDTFARIWPEEVPYEWEGRKYYNTGVYEVSWQKGDCDSTRTLHLTVVDTDTIETDVVLCQGEYYIWGEDTLRRSGIYTDLQVDSINKTKTLYLLNLEISSPINITSAYTTDMCAEDHSFDLYFTYQGKRPKRYSIYYDSYALQNKFVNIYNEPLVNDTVIHVSLEDVEYPSRRPDYYKMRLVLDNGVCGQSELNNIQLLVKYPDWIIEQNWNDVVAPLNAAKNGGFEFTQTQWYVNDVLQADNGLGYLHNDALNEGDVVYMRAMRKGESYFVPTCSITITEKREFSEYPTINPSFAPRKMPKISIIAQAEGTYAVYSSTGTILFTGTFIDGETPVMLPAVSGIYFVRIQQGEHNMTHKVVVF